MKEIFLIDLREQLRDASDEATRLSSQRFFKEAVHVYGISAKKVREIASFFFKAIQSEKKEFVFELCDDLLQSGILEESFIACHWSIRQKKLYEPSDFSTFESWIEKYISNWATCDTFCNHTMGEFLMKYPEFLPELYRWAQSDNLWMRRAAAVSLIVPARKGLFYDEIMQIASILLEDKEDMVQKGYGWLLKVNTTFYEEEVFRFVIKNKGSMPRTAFRYAIEKMPKELREIAMRRDF